MNTSKEPLDLSAIRQHLAEDRGRRFWRSLEEVAETAEFTEFLHREFPRHASEWTDPVSRRSFLKLMGASLALAGLTGCTANPYSIQYPNGKMTTYARQPEGYIPGVPVFYATAMPFRGFAQGLLAETHEGRPTKLEGNAQHPGSLGGTNIFGQASILGLYDPDRSRSLLKGGSAAEWADFVSAFGSAAQGLGSGAGLRILSGAVTSPTLVSQIEAILAQFPDARWYQYEPIGRTSVYEGARLAFGEPVETVYRFDAAEVILSLDADFLFATPGSLRYARDYAETRRVNEEKREMSRLYVVESTPSITGAIADHRLAVRASQVESIARAIAREFGVSEVQEADPAPGVANATWITKAVEDLKAAGSAAVVVAGEYQPPAVHALAHAINEALGAVGTTVVYTDPVEGNPADQIAGLTELVGAMNAGTVTTMLMLGGNPVFDAPADLAFGDALAKVPLSVHLSLYQDETSLSSSWHVHQAHFLESWSDARAFDGTASIIQPMINPLYGGKTAHEVVELLLGPERASYDIVRGFWQGELTGDFEESWRAALHDGLIANTAFAERTVTLDVAAVAAIPAGGLPTDSFEVIFRPDPTLWDGSFANNGWLQELPKPYTKITWDNAALISPTTAQQLGAQSGSLLNLNYKGASLTVPAWIQPGHPDQAVSLFLGYGRTRAGRVGNGTGFNTYPLRTSTAPWFDSGLQVSLAGGTYQLVSTQIHHALEGREIVFVGTTEEFKANPEFLHEGEKHNDYSLMRKDWEYGKQPNAWAMSIDTNVCIGCNACVTACQAENNIPVVGKEQVARGREMHWLRLDEYYEGSLDNPRTVYQLMACQQCENAPCEVVCPVAATMHDNEGINVMVYNRCVGTRYCSNNCPYKVRRYNFLQYNDIETPVIKLMRNPDVSVRNRGVMEKCNYCLQRINRARIAAKRDSADGIGFVEDGDITTACAAACPTRAIVFGNLNDENGEIVKYEKHPLKYDVLGAELNTKPRTTYLARLFNVNPGLAQGEPESATE